MLAHSPLPLVIDHFNGHSDIRAEEEEGTIFALKQRDRVRRVRLDTNVRNMQKLIVTMDEEYPMLEYLVVMPPIEAGDIPIAILPETLQAPHLRHLALAGFAIPIGSQLLTNTVGLVTLYLYMHNPSTYFHPNTLLQWLSFMPQLETIAIKFHLAVPNRDVESNSRTCRLLHLSPFQTFVISSSEVLVLTWKLLFIGSPPPASRNSALTSFTSSRFPSHVSCKL